MSQNSAKEGRKLLTEASSGIGEVTALELALSRISASLVRRFSDL